ncbi:M16 family metallopeptidase [Mucilaginibacter paludis]|uniref:Peptidase M16 domain protein n=1 Tax=Mucilaginibacter paludis DSM 18603 TaxID=714943 RepID=H1Y2Y1_9SPHI|nr:pitrilysin family protein [Mucilaginibacter paludis]EHQ28526.1 peptidase M16 domain protein [Mucilaginibacter paludis DSM 18603]
MKATLFTLILITACFTSSFAQYETSAFNVNGIKVIFKPTVKNMVSVRVYFRGGVSNYNAQQAGIEKLTLEAVTKCGTTKHTADQFKDIADYYDIDLSSTAEYDYGAIGMSCISKYFDKGWDLLADAVNNPVFNERELKLVKNKMIADIKQTESSPDKHIEQLTLKNAFEGTAYATDPDGTEETIPALNAEDLKKYYTTLLNKNKMFIVIAGKITKDEIIAKVSAAFGNIPALPYEEAVLKEPLWKDNKLVSEQRNLSTNYINGVLNAPVMTSPDFIPFRLGTSVLGGVLFSEIRTKRNLSYAPGAYSTNLRMPYAVMYVSTTNPAEAVSIMTNQLNRVKKLIVSNRALNEMKSSYITNNYKKLQSSSAITSNLGLAEIMGGWNFFEIAPNMLEQVTAEQIAQVMQKYIVGVRWSYLGDENQAKAATEAFNMAVK